MCRLMAYLGPPVLIADVVSINHNAWLFIAACPAQQHVLRCPAAVTPPPGDQADSWPALSLPGAVARPLHH